MTTLVIHAPSGKKTASGKQKTSFAIVLRTGIGPDYAICERGVKNLPRGSQVVLLDKRKKQRAEGRLVELHPTGKYIRQGVQRYNVEFEHADASVHYRSEVLNYCGIAVYDTDSGVRYCCKSCQNCPDSG